MVLNAKVQERRFYLGGKYKSFFKQIGDDFSTVEK